MASAEMVAPSITSPAVRSATGLVAPSVANEHQIISAKPSAGPGVADSGLADDPAAKRKGSDIVISVEVSHQQSNSSTDNGGRQGQERHQQQHQHGRQPRQHQQLQSEEEASHDVREHRKQQQMQHQQQMQQLRPSDVASPSPPTQSPQPQPETTMAASSTSGIPTASIATAPPSTPMESRSAVLPAQALALSSTARAPEATTALTPALAGMPASAPPTGGSVITSTSPFHVDATAAAEVAAPALLTSHLPPSTGIAGSSFAAAAPDENTRKEVSKSADFTVRPAAAGVPNDTGFIADTATDSRPIPTAPPTAPATAAAPAAGSDLGAMPRDAFPNPPPLTGAFAAATSPVAGQEVRQNIGPASPQNVGRVFPSRLPPSGPLTSIAHGSPFLAANGSEVSVSRSALIPKKRRLLRLEDGSLVVLPTNIYKQAGGVKLDLSLGGFRIDREKCTMKNRAFNFGMLRGFTRENLLTLRAFRNTIIPPDRAGLSSINPIAAAEALKRYDEEHLKPPPGMDASAYEGVGGWIPDSRMLHVTFVGSSMEMRVKASDLRAVDRPLQSKLALEALKLDPTVLEGKLESAPPVSQGHGFGGSDDVGMEPGSIGFAHAPTAEASAGPDPSVSIPGVGSEGSPAATVNMFKRNFVDASLQGGGGSDGGSGESGVHGFAGQKQQHRRRKKKKTVVAEDGVTYDLPTYVQNVEAKQHRSSLRLKMPLTGFLVNGEEVSVADLVVAYGLEITRKNLLALRACRDALLTNFDGPTVVKQVVAAEVFHVWAKRRGDTDGVPAATNAAATATTMTNPFLTPDLDADAANTLSLQPTTPPPPADPHTLKASEMTPSKADVGPSEGLPPSAGGRLVGSISVAGVMKEGENAAVVENHSSPAVGPSSISAAAASKPPSASEAGIASLATAVISDDDIIHLTGPGTTGAPRTKIQLLAGELRAVRQSRLGKFQLLLKAMLDDPVVQVGTLDVSNPPSCHIGRPPMPPALPDTPSGSAAAADDALEDTTRAIALLSRGKDRNGDGEATGGGRALSGTAMSSAIPPSRLGEGLVATGREPGAASQGMANGGDGSDYGAVVDVGLDRQSREPQASRDQRQAMTSDLGKGAVATHHRGGAERWGDSLTLQRGKRAREERGDWGNGDQDSDRGKRGSTAGIGADSGQAPPTTLPATLTAAAIAGDGVDLSTVAIPPRQEPPAMAMATGAAAAAATPEGSAAASKRRRRLWMRAISENEQLHERTKKEAKRAFEMRQQQLLQWMVDEEAGQHDHCDGDAGPPPFLPSLMALELGGAVEPSD